MKRLLHIPPHWWFVVAVAAICTAIVIGGRADNAARDRTQRREDEAQTRAQIEACRRGNLVRADRQVDTRDPDDGPAERARVPLLFPLLNCSLTVRSGEEVPMAHDQVRRYIALVINCQTPLTVNGRVVGARPPTPPAACRTD